MSANEAKRDRALPLWRSLLYVPVTSEKFVEKAHERGADGIKLDLEDSIALSEKPRARTMVRDAAKVVGKSGADVLVRVNRPWRMLMADLEASIWPEVGGICLPKVDSAELIEFVDEAVGELEIERGIEPGTTRYMVLIETPRGYANARAIAHASPRIDGITLGQEDFCAAMGMRTESSFLIPYMQQIAVCAREAGVLPIGYPGSIVDFTDLDAFRASAEKARALGFEGGSAIHPRQVDVLNQAFMPTEQELDWSEGVVAAYDKALAEGVGAVTYEGKMIDVPVVERGRHMLAIRDKIRARG